MPKQTDRLADRQTSIFLRPRQPHCDRQADRDTRKDRDREGQRDTETNRDRERHRERSRERDFQPEKDATRGRQTGNNRKRSTMRHTDRLKGADGVESKGNSTNRNAGLKGQGPHTTEQLTVPVQNRTRITHNRMVVGQLFRLVKTGLESELAQHDKTTLN